MGLRNISAMIEWQSRLGPNGLIKLKFIYLSQIILHSHCNAVTVKIP